MSNKFYIELLDRFFQGLTSEKENETLKVWIREPEAKEVFYEYYQQSWYLASDDMDTSIQENMLSEILNEIEESTNTGKKKKRKYSIYSYTLRYAAVAACITFIVGIGAYFFGQNQVTKSGNPVTMSVANGQKADITLADGTQVYINSDSKITYDNSYNKANRIITLEGEAYFDVAKDKSKPFIVKAKGINVEALGTGFNMKAYENDNTVSVILIEGKVKVDNGYNEEILNPNERIEYNVMARTFAKSELHPNADHLLWRSKELIFYGESLEEICKTLTRMYNWKFVFKSETIKHYTYTGVIKNNSLDNVMNFICQTAAIRYEAIPSENTIVIYKK